MLKKIRPLLLSLKKQAPLIIICAVVVITCRQVLFAHYENIAKGKKSDLIYALESSLLDLRFNARGHKKPNKKIGILAIDEKTIQEFKRWPFSRKYYGKALENLKKAGVNWVGFDVIFSEPETASIDDASTYLDLIKNSPPGMIKNNVNTALSGIAKMQDVAPGDLEFAKGISNFERVVLGFFYYQDEHELKLAGKENDPFQYLDPMESSMIEMIISPDENFELGQFPQLNRSGVVANIPQLGRSTNHFAFFFK